MRAIAQGPLDDELQRVFMTVDVLTVGPKNSPAHLVFSHGAGAGMSSVFLERLSGLLADAGVCVHRFEFAYMAARRDGGSRRPPPRADKLMGEYEAAVEQIAKAVPKKSRLYIGGKSMGGRVASMIADNLWSNGAIAGLVCVGYPFHPPGKPEKLRTDHLKPMVCPALIVQGTRDPFGGIDEVKSYGLSKAIEIAWIEKGDHDFKGTGRGGMDAVASKIIDFVMLNGSAA